MDPGFGLSPTEIYELLGVAGGVLGTGVLGWLVVRRARASRQRLIDEAGEGRPSRELPRRRTSALEPATPEPEAPEAEEPDEELQTPPPAREVAREAPARPRAAASGGAAPAPAVQARGADVLPFPSPAVTPPPAAPGPIEKPTAPAPPRKKKDVAALAPGLARTRSTGFIAGLGALFAGRKELDPSIVEGLEKVLLTADIGVKTSQKLLEEIRISLSRKELSNPDAIWAFLRQRSAEILSQDVAPIDFGAAKPFVLLTIGVNGSGKTTTIGKLAKHYRDEGRRVVLAAGDTFRAAAVEQLQIWGERTGCPVVVRGHGADAAGLAYDALVEARAMHADVLLIDTAGRLHNKADLMAELQKLVRSVKKLEPAAPHAVLLVLDATVGQNAHAQAEIFRQMVGVTGIVMTKLDGTAKGGVLVSLAEKYGIPIHPIGVGESAEDLRPFEAQSFARGLVGLEG